MTDKTPLIFLPGLLSDEAFWAHQVENLADVADIHVADLTGQDSIKALARHVLKTAPLTFAVAGLSMGGYVAQEIMRQEPSRVTHLALLDTNAFADDPKQSKRRKTLIKQALNGDFEAIARLMIPALVHPDHVDVPHIKNKILDMAKRVGVTGFVNQQTAIMNRVDGQGDLGKIVCPSLVLCGDSDQICPPDVHQNMADAIGANATFTVVPHAGHFPPLEQPEPVTDALRAWLERS